VNSRELADLAWSDVADLLDLQLSPLGEAAIDALGPQCGHTILDVGCGAGQTLLQLASRVGATGRVIGVDIAPRVLEIARSRTAHLQQVQLIQADAATLSLPNESVDGVFSRFGVMGLEDPVAAFANLRRIMRGRGRLSFVCWRSLDENELDLLPIKAANLDIAIDSTPFKFERREYLTSILRSAGFGEIAIEARDTRVSSGGIDAMMTVLTKVGPLGKVLRENPALVAGVAPKPRTALMSKSTESGVSLGAATWIVTASA
jgi:ubiquinone/menaquinone biosynthesis C-methylase UbiE